MTNVFPQKLKLQPTRHPSKGFDDEDCQAGERDGGQTVRVPLRVLVHLTDLGNGFGDLSPVFRIHSALMMEKQL